MNRSAKPLLAALFCLFTTLPTLGAVTMEIETTYRYQDQIEGVTTSVLYADARFLRMGVISDNFEADPNTPISASVMEDAAATGSRNTQRALQRSRANQHSEMFFDAEDRVITVVDHLKRRLQSLREKSAEDSASQEQDNPFAMLGGAMKELQQGIEDLPEDQRRQVEGLLSGFKEMAANNPNNGVHPTGEMDTVDGLTCEVYEERKRGQLIATHCVVDPSAITGGKLVNEHFKQMAEVYQAAVSNFGMPGSLLDMGLLAIDGFSIRTRTLRSDGTIRSESLLKRDKKPALPSRPFVLPDYPQLSLLGR